MWQSPTHCRRIEVIDSHTAGEPTRVVLRGGPELGEGPLTERCRLFREGFDRFRSAIVNEPHGSDVMVGALLVKPFDTSCAAGVIFFNNVGYLGMCGHGTIGVVATLAHQGRLKTGHHRIETPVGIVDTELHADGAVTVANVPSYMAQGDVKIQVPKVGEVCGDVAWGGNWFFLTKAPVIALEINSAAELTDYAWRVRQAVNAQGYPKVDHIELFAPARGGGDARNFVLCPGKAYDRSPCGTGTSAKLACLAARGQLAAGETWVQESIIGSTFQGRFQWQDEKHILPFITGYAYVNAESVLLVNEHDPYCWGIGL